MCIYIHVIAPNRVTKFGSHDFLFTIPIHFTQIVLNYYRNLLTKTSIDLVSLSIFVYDKSHVIVLSRMRVQLCVDDAGGVCLMQFC